VPSTVSRGDEHYHYANVFPNFVVSGGQHLSPDESSITGVEFSLDEAATLFPDFRAFGWIPDANDLIELVVAKEPPMRQRRIGAGAQLIYFAGQRQIFSSETVIGTISASHNPVPRMQVPAEAGFKNYIAVEIAFAEGICFAEAIRRTTRVIELMGLIVGRPQNLSGLHLRTTVELAPRGLTVHFSMFPGRDSSKEFKRPDSFDILLDAVDRPTISRRSSRTGSASYHSAIMPDGVFLTALHVRRVTILTAWLAPQICLIFFRVLRCRLIHHYPRNSGPRRHRRESFFATCRAAQNALALWVTWHGSGRVP
jgi:hypothetical protein